MYVIKNKNINKKRKNKLILGFASNINLNQRLNFENTWWWSPMLTAPPPPWPWLTRPYMVRVHSGIYQTTPHYVNQFCDWVIQNAHYVMWHMLCAVRNANGFEVRHSCYLHLPKGFVVLRGTFGKHGLKGFVGVYIGGCSWSAAWVTVKVVVVRLTPTITSCGL